MMFYWMNIFRMSVLSAPTENDYHLRSWFLFLFNVASDWGKQKNRRQLSSMKKNCVESSIFYLFVVRKKENVQIESKKENWNI